MSKHVSPRRFLPPRRRFVAPLVAVTVLGTVVAGAALIGADGREGTGVPSSSDTLPAQSLVATEPSASATSAPSSSPETTQPDQDQAHQRAQTKKHRQQLLARRAEALARLLQTETTFRLASFNVLGDSHTTRGGNKARYASGSTRVGWAVQAINAAGLDVVGLQEYESVQHNAFMRRTSGSWEVYPGTSMGAGPVRNSIAWRSDTWTAVQLKTIAIPYFRGARVDMPYVELMHNETGQRVWFINIHNPASNRQRGNNEHWRDLGTTLQINLMNELKADGSPVILMGDFNERAEAFCRVTSGADAIAANGGSSSPCQPPAGHGIDWIFGTSDITFSSYARLRTPLIGRISDHPMITSTATVGGSVLP